MESGIKDQVQGRARARPLNMTTAERAEDGKGTAAATIHFCTEGHSKGRRSLSIRQPLSLSQPPPLSLSLSLGLQENRWSRLYGWSGVASAAAASLEFMDVGEPERGDGRTDGRGRTDHYVEWPGGNMKAKSLSSIQPKYQSERRGRTWECLLACTMLNASPQYMCSSLRVIVLIDGASSSSFQKPIKEHKTGGASK